MIRKIVEKLFWHYQEKDNWAMKMNEPITIRKLTKEEAQEFLLKRRLQKQNMQLNLMDNRTGCKSEKDEHNSDQGQQ